MAIRSGHLLLANYSPVYRSATETADAWIGRTITVHLPQWLKNLACRISYLIDTLLPHMVPLAVSIVAAPFMGKEVVVGAFLYLAYTIANSLQFYPYDYLEALDEPAFSSEVESMVVRQDLANRIAFYLSAPTANNVLLVGPAGSGKTSAAYALVNLIQSNACPESLKGHKVYRLRLDLLMSNTHGMGDFEMRFLTILQALKSEKAILFIDEVHQITDRRGGSATPLSDLLKPFLSQGLWCLAATTVGEYPRVQEDQGLDQRFTAIEMPPLTPEICIEILKKKFPGLSDVVAAAAMQKAEELYPNQALPRSAIRFLEKAQHQTRALPTIAALNQQALYEKASIGTLANPRPPSTQEHLLQGINRVSGQLGKLLENRTVVA